MKHWKGSLGLVPAFLAVSGAAHAQTIAFNTANGTVGHQNFSGSLGLDFNVVSTIEVTNLGFFDSASDGIKGSNTTITVQLYDRNNTSTPLATATFSKGKDGTLASNSGFRFSSISFLTLNAGFDGRIVASGFNSNDPNGNNGHSFGDPAPTMNAGGPGGMISFPNDPNTKTYHGWYALSGGVYPTSADPQGNVYLAGSFEFQNGPRTPEPGALALLFGISVPSLSFVYHRLRRKSA
ncbi:MAG TPA: hypothetical protein VKU00_17855 [Chthonomonadaceae bacterium]|nr:hypothetical protein [Chthonomonadaceae bacterium]